MNKILTFFTAPVTALFLPQVHRDAVKNPASRGILYILYLASLATVLFLVLCFTLAIPQTDSFSKWASANVPTMIWTPEGLRMENQELAQPIKLEHPFFGVVAILDMNKTEVTEADFGKGNVYITSRKIFVKRGPQQIQEFNTTRTVESGPILAGNQVQAAPSKVRITGNVVEAFYQTMKKIIVPLMAAAIFLLVFFIGLFSSLFYSIVGLLLNLMRKNKLRYGAIFNLTCFATTAGFTITCLKAVLPFIPFSLLLLVAINLIYMFVFFKITDQEA